jgi:hypothetical protein
MLKQVIQFALKGYGKLLLFLSSSVQTIKEQIKK